MSQDLRDALARIEGKLDTILSAPPGVRKPLFGIKALTLYLVDVSIDTVTAYRQDPTFPQHRLPTGTYVFLPDEVDAWLAGLPR